MRPLRSLRGRRMQRVGVVVVGSLLLSGCQGSEAGDSPPASGGAAGPSASSTAGTAGPAADLQPPEKPAGIDAESQIGLETFTRYWFELLSYGYESNDWVPLQTVTDRGCDTCTNVIGEVRKHYESGGWITGGRITVNSISTSGEPGAQGPISSYVELEQTELKYLDKSGREAAVSDALPPTRSITIAVHKNNRWVMLDFGSPSAS